MSKATAAHSASTSRGFWRALCFRANGRPKKPSRKLLFRNDGQPRSAFRSVVLHADGPQGEAMLTELTARMSEEQ